MDSELSPDHLIDSLDESARKMLIALPLRVGLWMSASDTSGGAESDAAERQVLETMVTAYAEDYLKSEFVQRVMDRTVQAQAQWGLWCNNLDYVIAECKEVLDALAPYLPPKEIQAFKFNLYEIAENVAQAYEEHEDGADTLQARITRFIRGTKKEASGGAVSVLEEKALQRLRAVLEV